MSTTQNQSQKPFDWMLRAGVGMDDVQWLSMMDGSLALHSNQNRARVETIFTKAMTGVLESPSPVDLLHLMKQN
jgi:hypothetical protein